MDKVRKAEYWVRHCSFIYRLRLQFLAKSLLTTKRNVHALIHPISRHADMFDDYARHVETMMTHQQWDPQVTVDVMIRSLLSRGSPPARINVGMDARYATLLLSMVPVWVQNAVVRLLMPDPTPTVMGRKIGARKSLSKERIRCDSTGDVSDSSSGDKKDD